MTLFDSRRSIGMLFTCTAVAALVAAAPALAAPGPQEGSPSSPVTQAAPGARPDAAGDRLAPPDAVAVQRRAAVAARKPERAHSFEITLGGEFLLPQGLGAAPANLIANNSSSTPYLYFATAATRATAPSFSGGIGYGITDMIAVEGRMLVGRGNLNANVTNDAEHVAATVVTGTLTQYFFDVSVVARLPHVAGGAGVPFVEAGAGYLRQLQETSTVVQTGQIYHFGGGVTYFFRKRAGSGVSGLGLRVDARVYLPKNGYTFDGGTHAFAAVGAGLVLAF